MRRVLFQRLPALLVLGLLIAAASLLAWSLPGRALAGTMFQSSPPISPLATATAIATPAPSATATRPAPTRAVRATPAAVPGQAPTRAVAPAAVAPSAANGSPADLAYLPAPTLTLPGKVPQIALRSADTAAGDTTSEPPADVDAASDVPAGSGLARLIDRVAVLLGYAWLLVGSLVLVGAAIFLGWLLRHTTAHD